MASFNYSALMTPGGLSEQLGHLAGVIAQANATNRATDVASRRADIDQAFREAQLQHYKNLEERQGLTGAMNPLQQAAIREHEAKAGYYDHLTNKAAAPKPPAMTPAAQQQLPLPGVVSNPLATPADPDEAPSTMIRHIQDAVVGPTVKDKLAHGASPTDAVALQKQLTDTAMEAQGYPYDPMLGKYTRPKPLPASTPPWGVGTVGGQPPLGVLTARDNGQDPSGAPSAGGAPVPLPIGSDVPGNPGVTVAAPLTSVDMHPTWTPGGLGAAMAAPAPAPIAAAPAANGKVIPASALKMKAAQLYGGDVAAAAAHAQALGYTIDQSR